MSKRKKTKYIVQDIKMTDEVEILGPEFLELESNFESISAWLSEICKTDQPNIKIEEFKIGLFESENEYVLSLIGVNSYNNGLNSYKTQIDYRPTFTFYRLPDKEIKNLKPDQVKQKITEQLMEFSSSDTFKQSFLTKSSRVIIEFNGQRLWTK